MLPAEEPIAEIVVHRAAAQPGLLKVGGDLFLERAGRRPVVGAELMAVPCPTNGVSVRPSTVRARAVSSRVGSYFAGGSTTGIIGSLN